MNLVTVYAVCVDKTAQWHTRAYKYNDSLYIVVFMCQTGHVSAELFPESVKDD